MGWSSINACRGLFALAMRVLNRVLAEFRGGTQLLEIENNALSRLMEGSSRQLGSRSRGENRVTSTYPTARRFASTPECRTRTLLTRKVVNHSARS
jgi:hypothetical protein